MPVRAQLDLPGTVSAADPRAADRHPPTTQRDLPILMAMAHRRALPIVATLRSHDLVDLGLHELVQHSQPDTNAERQQPFPGGAGELAERLTHPLRQLLNAGVLRRDRRDRYGPHSGWSSVSQ